MSAAEIKDYFFDKTTEQDLADAYAITHNKFWSVVDNQYDHEEGSPEYISACAIADEWGNLMDEYKNRIFEILTNEGITVPATVHIHVLIPFMARFGYIDSHGWWIKQKKSEVHLAFLLCIMLYIAMQNLSKGGQ